MSKMIVHPDRESFTRAVADTVAGAIADAIAARDRAFVAFAGGATPLAILPAIVQRPLDWSKLMLTVSDERWVPLTDPLSNAGALRPIFIRSPAGAARRLPLVQEPGDLLADAATANMGVAIQMPCDLVWAGMGEDGHTLSWFPGPDLETAYTSRAAVVAVRPDPLPPNAPVARVTFTLAAVRAARAVLLAATGEAKRAILDNPGDYPVARLLALPQTVVHWAP